MQKLKTITSHVGYGRFLAELPADAEGWLIPVGYLPRVKSIPSPYASSPVDIVYAWNGTNIITREVKHKVYEVFAVPADVTIFGDEDAATAAFLASVR
jgi:hypothetical protein